MLPPGGRVERQVMKKDKELTVLKTPLGTWTWYKKSKMLEYVAMYETGFDVTTYHHVKKIKEICAIVSDKDPFLNYGWLAIKDA